ncbi:MAG: GNAT family N-acetyltransferase [Thermoplasmata archaeon]
MAALGLAPIPAEEYQRWWDLSVRDYAKDHVEAGNWDAGEALARSEAEFRKLLPQGTATPGHFLYALEDRESRQHVGLVWFHADRTSKSENRNAVFIYDLLVYEPFRGKGYGSGGMRLVEEKARELGFDTISLHVFGHNRVAIALYEKLGYVPKNILMSKKIDLPAGPPSPPEG